MGVMQDGSERRWKGSCGVVLNWTEGDVFENDDGT